MMQPHHTHRRADRGTLIVRASAVALGLTAAAGLQIGGPAVRGPDAGVAGDPSPGLCADANGSFAFQ